MRRAHTQVACRANPIVNSLPALRPLRLFALCESHSVPFPRFVLCLALLGVLCLPPIADSRACVSRHPVTALPCSPSHQHRRIHLNTAVPSARAHCARASTMRLSTSKLAALWRSLHAASLFPGNSESDMIQKVAYTLNPARLHIAALPESHAQTARPRTLSFKRLWVAAS